MRKCLALLGAVTLFASGACAQNVDIRNDPQHPLQIVSVSPGIGVGSSINGVEVVFRNIGAMPVVALSASVLIRFNDSRTRRISLSQDHIGLGYGPGGGPGSPLGPGQSYERVSAGRIVPAPGRAITGITARVDYIEMADGTTYGSDPDGIKVLFTRMRSAKQTERARLLRLYREKGLNDLLNDLGRR